MNVAVVNQTIGTGKVWGEGGDNGGTRCSVIKPN